MIRQIAIAALAGLGIDLEFRLIDHFLDRLVSSVSWLEFLK